MERSRWMAVVRVESGILGGEGEDGAAGRIKRSDLCANKRILVGDNDGSRRDLDPREMITGVSCLYTHQQQPIKKGGVNVLCDDTGISDDANHVNDKNHCMGLGKMIFHFIS